MFSWDLTEERFSVGTESYQQVIMVNGKSGCVEEMAWLKKKWFRDRMVEMNPGDKTGRTMPV